MSIFEKKAEQIKSADSKPLPQLEPGSYAGVVVSLVDLGMVTDSYKGEESTKHKIWIEFSFPSESFEIETDEGPQTLTHRRGITINVAGGDRSTLSKYVAALCPGGTIGDLLGKSGLITIGKTSGGNAKIASVAPPMKGMEFEVATSELKLVDSDSEQFIIDELPPFVVEMLQGD